MRIVVVSDAWTPQVNGVVTTLRDLRSRLQAIGHEVNIIEPSLFRRLRCPGYPEIELAWGVSRQLAHFLDASGADAIHIATEGPLGLAARRHCRSQRIPFTTAFHSRFPEFLNAATGIPARWGYALMRRFHAPSSGVMVPSRGTCEILAAHGFRNLRPWSHGIDLDLFSPRARSVMPPWPRPMFLFVGRISVEKNLEAFLRLDLPGSKVVCGSGPLLDRFRARYPHVHWAGPVPRERLVDYYRAADSFVYPSRTDTFGLVMLEALACGTPVAALPVAGPLDVVGDSNGGILDLDLGRAALRSLDVPRECARARAMAFDWDVVAREFVSYLAPITEPRPLGPRPALEPVTRGARA
ncbi:MAG TPA: glycosyltransferase family 1 protein [Caldimonas sp.]|jgi:glycosyltransferase involved in cell wall biosynthesis|nr:glycosyltransferase family 1 protein [Caldimonas sp.]HEX4235889.1 glycosyltransferase family 1 protein [Caldimonas sp.]